jgi:hypothetical protein
MINKSIIDGNGNVVIQDSDNSTITINTNNPEEIRKFFIDFQSQLRNLPNDILELMESKNPNSVVIDNDANVYLSFNLMISDSGQGYALGVTITNLTKENRFFNTPFFKTSETIEHDLDTFIMTNAIYKIQFPKKLEYGEVVSESYEIKPGAKDIFEKVIAKNGDAFIQAITSTTLGEVFKSNKYSIKQLLLNMVK